MTTGNSTGIKGQCSVEHQEFILEISEVLGHELPKCASARPTNPNGIRFYQADNANSNGERSTNHEIGFTPTSYTVCTNGYCQTHLPWNWGGFYGNKVAKARQMIVDHNTEAAQPSETKKLSK